MAPMRLALLLVLLAACAPAPPPPDAAPDDAPAPAAEAGPDAGRDASAMDDARTTADARADVASEGCDPPCPQFGWRCDPDRVCRPLDAGAEAEAATCPPGQTLCPGVGCVDLSRDVEHCLTCNLDCTRYRGEPGEDVVVRPVGVVPVCISDRDAGPIGCTARCAPGYIACPLGSLNCVDPLLDRSNCGACGRTCADTMACVAGRCCFAGGVCP
jgi:hypothetical protein